MIGFQILVFTLLYAASFCLLIFVIFLPLGMFLVIIVHFETGCNIVLFYTPRASASKRTHPFCHFSQSELTFDPLIIYLVQLLGKNFTILPSFYHQNSFLCCKLLTKHYIPCDIVLSKKYFKR